MSGVYFCENSLTDNFFKKAASIHRKNLTEYTESFLYALCMLTPPQLPYYEHRVLE